jgi:hypothetical protein
MRRRPFVIAASAVLLLAACDRQPTAAETAAERAAWRRANEAADRADAERRKQDCIRATAGMENAPPCEGVNNDYLTNQFRKADEYLQQFADDERLREEAMREPAQ